MTLTQTAFRGEIKNGLCGAYFFYGDEEYLKHFYENRIKATVLDSENAQWNEYIIEGKKAKRDSCQFPSLQEALNAVPMMSEKVYIKYTADFTLYSADEQEELFDLVKSQDTSSSVLLVVATPGGFAPGNPAKGKPTAIYKKFDSLFKILPLEKQPHYELRKWIERRVEKEGLALYADAADALILRSGTYMYALSGELDKICAYAKANSINTIDKGTIAKICSANEEEEAFAMANAILNGDRRKALKSLHICKTSKTEPYMVLGLVGKSLTDMFAVSVLMSEGLDKKAIVQRLKLNEYKAGLIMGAVKNTSPEKLAAAIKRLKEADKIMKTGGGGYIALERFLCTIPLTGTKR